MAPRSGLVTDVVATLAAAGISVDDLALRQPSLDDVFHALTRPPATRPVGGPAVPGGERAA